MLEYRRYLQPDKPVGSVEAQRTWFEIKADIEAREFKFPASTFKPDKKCNRCNRRGHSSKTCVHDSQYFAFYLNDIAHDRKSTNFIKLDDFVQPNVTLILKRLPWNLACKMYKPDLLWKYAGYREQILFSDDVRKQAMERIVSLEPKKPRVKRQRDYSAPPPEGYICHTCGEPGHWRERCPEHDYNKSNKSNKRAKVDNNE